MRAKAKQLLAPVFRKQPHARDCTHYGDRIEIRNLWARSTDPETMNLYGASQVFAVEREVIPLSKAVKRSKERCYAITCATPADDRKRNGEELLKTFRGHWCVEAKNHYCRDVTFQEDRSPVKNHNAARVLATMKMLAVFLCQIEAHHPQSDRERTLPEFNRTCAVNGIDTALNWMTRKYNPLGR